MLFSIHNCEINQPSVEQNLSVFPDVSLSSWQFYREQIYNVFMIELDAALLPDQPADLTLIL